MRIHANVVVRKPQRQRLARMRNGLKRASDVAPTGRGPFDQATGPCGTRPQGLKSVPVPVRSPLGTDAVASRSECNQRNSNIKITPKAADTRSSVRT